MFPPLLPCVVVFGGFVFGCCRGFAADGACGTHAVFGGFIIPTTTLFFGVFSYS